MKHEIRRKDRIMDDKEAIDLLEKSQYGVLSMIDLDDEAYGIPLSFIYEKNHIYFHCANEGFKINNIKNNPNVSFTCVGDVQAIYSKNFTTNYKSAMVFGKVEFINNDEEKKHALYLLCRKYLPNNLDKFEESFNASNARTTILRLDINQITAKKKKISK